MKRLAMWAAAVLMACSVGVAGAAEVLLGAGDVLKISVYGSPDLGLETRVSEAGSITFPLVGSVAVGGLSVAAAEKKLGQALESGGFLRKAQVNIIVTALQSQQVSVLGQVNRPGRYPIEGKRSLLDILAMAGGQNTDGGDVVSLIRKRGGTTTKETIDIVDMMRSADLARDFDLTGNDVLYVERAPRFYIYGEVQRPGAFRLERSMTVLQALSVGGGLTQRGTERGVRIKRRDAAGVMQILDAKHDDIIQIDDVVYVKESWF
ncbi:polysialic acid transport protein KpsD precursor [Janthinobacterium sp. HH104]|uniref:Polysaccharide export outer membrane protein n=2 Tax=Janthinobacterium TaxID=29580 RepID=A0AB38C920_9BURK|nr:MULTISPECIES: polysaccharide export protein EpsE [Janthinobacterium]EZP39616.1 Polysaccharide export protein EpsE [Janthinobacterium lividum]OEZ81974.1 polysialic acid transport protein KpsD precursor [Janthinobacterium sp. HH104]SFX68662.1 polysaccharide export outer membrane protein [Janthinobacterium lividum]